MSLRLKNKIQCNTVQKLGVIVVKHFKLVYFHKKIFENKMVVYLDWNLFMPGAARNYDVFNLEKIYKRRGKICNKKNISWFAMVFDWLRSKR